MIEQSFAVIATLYCCTWNKIRTLILTDNGKKEQTHGQFTHVKLQLFLQSAQLHTLARVSHFSQLLQHLFADVVSEVAAGHCSIVLMCNMNYANNSSA